MRKEEIVLLLLRNDVCMIIVWLGFLFVFVVFFSICFVFGFLFLFSTFFVMFNKCLFNSLSILTDYS